MFAEPQAVALLEEVTKLNALMPDVWLFPCQRIVGKGKDRPFDKQFDYILKLNHGVFHANQGLVYRRNLIVAISDEAWDKLKTQTLKSGIANVLPSSFSSLAALLRTKFQAVMYLRKFKQITGHCDRRLSNRRSIAY